MMNVASHGFAFYDTDLAPKFKMGCEDPIETVLSAADEFGVKFFVSNDYWALDLDAVKMMTKSWAGREPNAWKKFMQDMDIIKVSMVGISQMNHGWILILVSM